MKTMWKVMGKILAVLSLSVMMSVSAQAAGTTYVNIAAFHKVNAGYEFEPAVFGKFSEFIAEMEKGSEIMFLNHTSGVKTDDVITFNASVLRDETGADFGDNGVNCSFNYKVEGEGDQAAYNIGGLCHLLVNMGEKQEKVKVVIPSADLPDTSEGVDVWAMIYEDKETGTAFYANVSGK